MEEKVNKTDYVGSLLISGNVKNTLLGISKWANFLSILAFIILGLSVFLILGVGILITSTNRYMEMQHTMYYNPGIFQWSYVIVYLIIILLNFLPAYFLYRFSVGIKKSIETDNIEMMENAFGNLKTHYTFIGVYSIIAIVLYVISSIFLFSTMVF